MFKASIDVDGLKTRDFVVNPFTALMIELFNNGDIPLEEAQIYEAKIQQIIKYGLENCMGTGCTRWQTIADYAPARLESFETVEGFYGCEYYMEKFYTEFEENPDDCDLLRTVYSRLNWGGCSQEDPRFLALIEKGEADCVTSSGLVKTGYECLTKADYDCAIQNFLEVIATTDDLERKAKFELLIAKIYNAHLKNFPISNQK